MYHKSEVQVRPHHDDEDELASIANVPVVVELALFAHLPIGVGEYFPDPPRVITTGVLAPHHLGIGV